MVLATAMVFVVAVTVLIMPVNDLEEDSDWEIHHFFGRQHQQWLSHQEQTESGSESPDQPLTASSITHSSYLSTDASQRIV